MSPTFAARALACVVLAAALAHPGRALAFGQPQPLPPAPPPTGWLDAADSGSARGWAYDAALGTAPVTVQIFSDGALFTSVTANQSRPDLVVNGGAPDPNHGFTASLAGLAPGAHTIDAYAVSRQGSLVKLLGSGKSYTGSATIASATTDGQNVTLAGQAQGTLDVIEVRPYEAVAAALARPPVGSASGTFSVAVPRFDGARDRLYSSFVLASGGVAQTLPVYVGDVGPAATRTQPFPATTTKKGLFVRNAADALALGIQHTTVNVVIDSLTASAGSQNPISYAASTGTYQFDAGAVAGIDAQVKPLSDAGVVVNLILLVIKSGNPALDGLFLHPRFSASAPFGIGAFNTVTPDGVNQLIATVEFLADRYSQPGYPHGHAPGWIVGNEVNDHWTWCNAGDVSMDDFTTDYLNAVRLVTTATRKFDASARTYVSLDHYWGIQDPNQPASRAFPGRAFLDSFASRAAAAGDFPWGCADHPYPSGGSPRTWEDTQTTNSLDTPLLTFRNLGQLPAYFQQSQLLYQGQQRHVILSEQGFPSLGTPQGETDQAAAYCYAWVKLTQNPGIDSFVYFDQVDTPGATFGVWTDGGNLSDGRAKPIHDVMAGVESNFAQVSAFALPDIGITDWSQLQGDAR